MLPATNWATFIVYHYHFLQLQYRAFHLGPGLAQLCLARKLLRRAGFDFLIRMLGSPKLTLTTLPALFFTYTRNFFTSPRNGLPKGTSRP